MRISAGDHPGEGHGGEQIRASHRESKERSKMRALQLPLISTGFGVVIIIHLCHIFLYMLSSKLRVRL